MISFKNKKYELFFSNALPPLTALNYADELFFKGFKRFCGARYRILSVIKNGWQVKYARVDDMMKLKKVFKRKIRDGLWIERLLVEYEFLSGKFRQLLNFARHADYKRAKAVILAKGFKDIRAAAAPLDALSNLLHLFSELAGPDFLPRLSHYSKNIKAINKNFLFYTQPIKESRYAKIKMRNLSNKFALSKFDGNFSAILRAGVYIKDDVSELLDERNKKLGNLFREIARRIGCSVDDLQYLQGSEIAAPLTGGTAVNRLIKERREITVLYYQNKSLAAYAGKGAKEFLQKGKFRQIPAEQNSKIFYGECASLGKAQGQALVVKTSAEALAGMKARWNERRFYPSCSLHRGRVFASHEYGKSHCYRDGRYYQPRGHSRP